MIDFEYTQNPEIDADIFAEELNEEPEQFETTDISDNASDTDIFDDEVNISTRLDIEAVNAFVTTFSGMVAGMISAFTGMPQNRYMPPAAQRKELAKSIVNAFPSIQMSPKATLIFVLVMTYAPIGVTTVQDLKINKGNETNTTGDNIGHEWDRKDNLSEEIDK